MYCLTSICYVCLKQKGDSLIDINSSLSVNKDILHIIGYLPFNLGWMKTKRIILICEECCRRLRETYQLLAMCLKNSAVLQGYMKKLNNTSISDADNDAEPRVYLNNKQDDTNQIKCEIKLEEEEIYTVRPIIEEREDVFVNVDGAFVKEEDTWRREEVEGKEESPMDNNFTENSDKETDSEISVYSNTHDTDTDSDSSGFTRKQVHAKNKKEMDEAAKKSYTCSTCTQTFCTKFDLRKHRRVHPRDKPHECSDCGKCFITKWDLCNHKRVHTGEKPFKCSTCEKCFSHSFNLVRHLKSHTGEKAYECSICKNRFSQSSNLATHMRIHTGEKPFKCSRCDKCFGHKFVLVQHMRVHTGEKPFKCVTCEKCFSQSSSLGIHMRTHTGEKPYECSICKKCFALKSSLATHMRMHTGEKPFKCVTCEKCFSQSSSLGIHMRTHSGT